MTAAARIREYEPEFITIASAIRSFLRNEYADFLRQDDAEIPSRLSSYSGKGVGFYATSDDGRADWTPAFKQYIFSRTDGRKGLEFTFERFHTAFGDLKTYHPRWHAASVAYDIESQPLQYVAQALGVHVQTVHRYRKAVIHFLYPYLCGFEKQNRKRIASRSIPLIQKAQSSSDLHCASPVA